MLTCVHVANENRKPTRWRPRVRRSACVGHASLMGGERALLLDDIPCMRRKGPTLFAADPDYSIVVMFRRGLMRDVLETVEGGIPTPRE